MPTVSVIINCFNGAKYLREAMDSLFNQTYPDWEVIFWDNASTDESAEIATSYGEKVRYFRSDATASLGFARNLAFAQARGDYLAILDADDIWLPLKLERQMPLFQADPTLAMTYHDSIYFGANGDRYRLFQMVNPKRGRVFGDLLTKNFISSETMVFRRTALENLDYFFDARLGKVMDYDLCLRVAYTHGFDYVDEPLSKWRMHSSSWSNVDSMSTSKELSLLIENLLYMRPEISTSYPGQLKTFRKSLAYSQAIENWRRGDTTRARKHLSDYLQDKKFLLVHLATWLVPYKLFERLMQVLRMLKSKSHLSLDLDRILGP
jgi:glycosyltransferase involved in cell wall biosynthesis